MKSSPRHTACHGGVRRFRALEDVQAIEKMLISGVKGLFTMHGSSIEDIQKNIGINKLIQNNQIEKIIVLNSFVS